MTLLFDLRFCRKDSSEAIEPIKTIHFSKQERRLTFALVLMIFATRLRIKRNFAHVIDYLEDFHAVNQ